MKTTLFFSLLIILSHSIKAQTYKTYSSINMKPGYTLVRKTKIQDCANPVDSGSRVKTVIKYKNTDNDNETDYTITRDTVAGKNAIIHVDKYVEQDIKSFTGKANLFVDEDDPSIVHINYWLNDSFKIKATPKSKIPVRIKIITQKLTCNGDYVRKDTSMDVTKDTTFFLWKASIQDTVNDYFRHSNKIIEVSIDGIVSYYLVNKYDGSSDYQVQLRNREYLSFRKSSFDFGPITIPIKCRFGYGSVDPEFIGDLNIGAFAGYSVGKYRANYLKGQGFKELADISFTVGGFFSFSTVALDTNNTTQGKNPLSANAKQTIPTLSPGIGAMLSIQNFQLGVFLGFDIGITNNARNWNFNNRPWLGIGFAYSLSSFWTGKS